MNARREEAFSWIEVLVALAVLVILASLAMPAITTTCGRGQGYSQMLSNMKQLHDATQSTERDGVTTGDASILGWPGNSNGTFTNWAHQLVPSYLSSNDFCILLSAPGKAVTRGKLPDAMSESAVLVYAVSTKSPNTAVFLSSANFTNSPSARPPLSRSAKPFGNKGFVVFRKGGDGAILLPKQVNANSIIGSYVPLLD